ncbi:MAG: DUF4386 domain-containing protein [Spirosomataceae bacterium]
MTTLQKLGKTAGLLYLIIVVCGFWGIMYVPSQIIVKGHAATTLQKLLTHEFLFRSGTASQLLSSVVFLLLAMTFYRIFKNTHQYLAQLMVVFVLVQIPVVFLSEAFNITALMIAKKELMSSLLIAERQEMVYLFLRTYKYSMIILMIFWGLWLIPLGQLVIKSGYLPKIIGIFLILGGVAYIIQVLDYVLFSIASLLLPTTALFFIQCELFNHRLATCKKHKNPFKCFIERLSKNGRCCVPLTLLFNP